MVADIEPVADIGPVAVDRKRPPFERIQDYQGYQLLGEMKRAVIVRAIRGQGLQTESVVVGANQKVR